MNKKKILIGKKPKIESKSVGLMSKKCSNQFDLNSFFFLHYNDFKGCMKIFQ